MLKVNCGKEITVHIPLDGDTPTLHARDAVVELDTIVPIENGVKFLNNETGFFSYTTYLHVISVSVVRQSY